MMNRFARQLTESRAFRACILAVIGLAGVLAGLETDTDLASRHGVLLHVLDRMVIGIFILEIALKLLAHGSQPLKYFEDGWNVFDCVVVALCLLPVAGPFAAVLRLVRVLRLLRLVSSLPKLQLLVGALLKSLGSMGYVGLLLGLMFYIYSIIGVHLFGGQAPDHFGSLSLTLLSLFQIITLDNWSDLFSAAKGSSPGTAAAYFVSFILLGTMIMLNLFIGIIMNSMSEMHAEIEGEKTGAPKSASGTDHTRVIHHLEEQIGELRQLVRMLADSSGKTRRPSGKTHEKFRDVRRA